MLPDVIRDLLIFTLTVAGLGLPAWGWFSWTDNRERLALSIAVALLVAAHVTFALYLAGLPLVWLGALALAGWTYSLIRRETLLTCWRDRDTRRAVGHWLILSLWCLGLHSTIVSYSGGGWAGDWVEHYDRAQFFLGHWPVDFQFLERYPLPARPPLTNWITAGLLAQTGGAFYHYQIVTTLLSTLVFFPLSVLVKRWRGDERGDTRLLLVLMASPLFLQNATFPWTKLNCAFFVLLGLAQWMPARAVPLSRARLVTGAALLAGGLLAHYSAAPWIIALTAAGAWLHRADWREAHFRRGTGIAFASALAVCLPWFAWSLTTYGPSTTFTANTAWQLAPAGGPAERIVRALNNLAATFSPVVDLESDLLRQASAPGRWRDLFFTYYQLRLPWALGSGAIVALGWLWSRSRPAPSRTYWATVITGATFLGIVSHAQPDNFGLAHIALQPLALLGLACLCSQAGQLPRWLLRFWVFSVIFDFFAGAILHFGVQSLWLLRLTSASTSVADLVASCNTTALRNWHDQSTLQLTFLSEVTPPALVAVMLVAGILTATLLLITTSRKANPPARTRDPL